jgi:mRNA interferase MazF
MGRRPAVILSPKSYNQKAGLAIACPITSQIKEYPFEVPVNHRGITGAILSDQVRSLDWRQRKVRRIARLPLSELQMIRELLAALLGID